MKAAVVLLAALWSSRAEQSCQKEKLHEEEEDCSAGKTSERVVKLANGVLMPEVGFGTWKITDEKDIFQALDASLGSGYRLIDTAVVYNNHRWEGGREIITITYSCKEPSRKPCLYCWPSTV